MGARAEDMMREGKTVVFAAIDGALAAVLAVSDPIKPDSAAAIEALQHRGLRVVMLTGDRAASADKAVAFFVKRARCSVRILRWRECPHASKR